MLADLPPTQRQVLVALARPYKHDEFATPATNQEIASELFLSVDAVKSHLRTLFARFGIEHLPQNQKRSRLVAEALQSGVIATRDLGDRARALRLAEELVHEGDRHAALAHGRGHALDRPGADVAAGEDAGDARLEQVGVAVGLPARPRRARRSR